MPRENRIAEPQTEVRRYRFKGAASEYVYAADFDNATRCFLDAAERCLAAERREQALQLRLNAADQRVDVLEAQLCRLSKIGDQIRSQDNRCTDQPLFAVMEKRGLPTLDTHDHDRIDWVETESGDYCLADDTKARRLEALHQAGRDTPGWERYAMKDIDVFVTACFTEQGCKDFLARDGHNHNRPFIYAFGSYRNAEYQAVRDWLKSLPETSTLAASR
jgi:hypothetical protein